MDTLIHLFTQIAFITDIVGSAILIWAFLLSIFQLLRAMIKNGVVGASLAQAMRKLRLNLGNYLLLSLEIMIVGDVIHTVLEPTFEDIVLILSIVLIRTIIAYSLSNEMGDLRKEKEE